MDFNFRQPTNFDRSNDELLRFLLFGICAAGKMSKVIAPKLAAFEEIIPLVELPRWAEKPGVIRAALQHESVAMGQYMLKTRAFTHVSRALKGNPDWLREASVDELQQVPGVSLKTARFFILHSRPHAQVLVLDTHLSKALRQLGVPDIPVVDYRRPVSKRAYKRAEVSFLAWAREQAWYDPSDPATLARFDIERWTAFAVL